ncbi:MAG TPA: hypothetical protein VL358_07035 [Caulobacteraceae bacterium]|jgi:hypothetical protein|nr:hypothetical protein [Caulobacteraceae bacterium]
MIHVDPTSAAVDAVPADPSPTDRRAAARALVERQLGLLTRLAEVGLEIAEAAGRRALASPEGGAEGLAHPDPGLTYARVARAVRLTVALQARLAKDLLALDRADALARSAEAGARRARIHRMVERAIAAEHEDEDEIEQLSSDAWERLTDEDADGALIRRPLGEVVARICRDLGLVPDGRAWAGDDGALEIRAGESGMAARAPVAAAPVDLAPDPPDGRGGESPGPEVATRWGRPEPAFPP